MLNYHKNSLVVAGIEPGTKNCTLNNLLGDGSKVCILVAMQF